MTDIGGSKTDINIFIVPFILQKTVKKFDNYKEIKVILLGTDSSEKIEISSIIY